MDHNRNKNTISLKNKEADFFVKSYKLKTDGTDIEVIYKDKKLSFSYPLVGKFNIYNVMASISCAHAFGLSFNEIDKRLKTFPKVPGRLQQVQGFKFSVFIDFAHTPDALNQVLTTLKEINFNRIILVFGCGGDRDQDKRALMGSVASKYADFTFITSDNPRSEDPLKIIEMISSGMDKEHQKKIVIDRKEAIDQALHIAQKRDCVLIAGKGHENTQIFHNKTIEFSDLNEVSKWLNHH
jgi:UDP-N-acetylmuramoyl-L-alanyl-D-glutamate--2,6-diaminopimelate ligase